MSEAEQYYAAIGRALTTWGALEDALCTVFSNVVSPLSHGSARQAFWGVDAFRGKLKMTDAAVRHRFERDTTNTVATEWNAINNRLLKKAKKRNELAHGSVVNRSYRDNETKERKRDIFFAPYYWGSPDDWAVKRAAGIYDTRPENRLYLKDIAQVTDGFRSITERLRDLAGDIYEIERALVDRALEDE